MAKVRVDDLIVKLGLAPDKDKAQKIIMAGLVLVDEVPVTKIGATVKEDSVVRVASTSKFVGRGGDKLEGALQDLKIETEGRVAIDIGASTGGFTDCLLTHGAKLVHAVDVGTYQLDWKLRNDSRVVSREGVNARTLDALPSDTFLPAPNLAVIDVSFISIKLVIEPLLRVMSRPADVLAMVKPQFELPKEKVSEGGIVESEDLQKEACASVVSFVQSIGGRFANSAPSRVRGARKGNQEYFLHFMFE